MARCVGACVPVKARYVPGVGFCGVCGVFVCPTSTAGRCDCCCSQLRSHAKIYKRQGDTRA